ncbi:MAG: baseplate J/gp47 family protein, partial [Gemmatimonadaceae bacterium]
VATDSVDATAGFTRSGVVRLVADCATTKPTAVASIEAHWLRARLIAPLTSGVTVDLPEVDHISVRTVVDRTLPPGGCAALPPRAGIIPEQAYAGETKLDLTKASQPMGARPVAGSAFLLACDEALSRPGAEVTLCFRRVETAEEEADQQGADLALDINAAQELVVDAATAAANALFQAEAGIREFADLSAADAAIMDAAHVAVAGALAALATEGTNGIAALDDAARALLERLDLVTPDTHNNPSIPALALLPHLPPVQVGIIAAFGAFVTDNQGRVQRAGNRLQASAERDELVLESLKQLTPISAAMAAGATLPSMATPVVAWEYWNGSSWRALAVSGTPLARTLRADGPISFTVPDDMEPVELNGVTARWVRARLVSGGYGLVRVVTWKDATSGKVAVYPIVEHRSPTLDRVTLGYRWRSAEVVAEHVVAENDFRLVDHTGSASSRGSSFAPFVRVEDATPALYLGFDRPLPADAVGLYMDIAEVPGDDEGPSLAWEYSDGAGWLPLRARDGTRGLAVPGAVSVLSSGGGLLARFGTPRAWIRARLTNDGAPRRARVRGVWSNAVWASQLETMENETLGSSSGESGQVFFARRIPVLEGELLEVRELAGERARVEEPILRAELARLGVPEADVRSVQDARTGHTSEVWVRWRPLPNLLFAGPGERAYAVERTRGRIVFGGLTNGLAPAAGRDNVRLRRYRSGGGVVGNVDTGAARQILSGVLADGVTNVRAAEGGADGEPVGRVLRRAPQIVRHRRQAVTAADYEALALDASPAVAVARALPTTHPSGRFAPGWVTVRIVPHGTEPRPEPSWELREQVRRFLEVRAPATARRHVRVIPPLFLPVGVTATFSVVDPSAAGDVADRARAALAGFLHPLTGGPGGDGWPFGRDVYLSDVAALLEGVPGLDYVETLALSVDGVLAGERVDVPAARLVVAGAVQLTLSGCGG